MSLRGWTCGRADRDGGVGQTSGRGWIVSRHADGGGPACERADKGADERMDSRTGRLADKRTGADGGGRIPEG